MAQDRGTTGPLIFFDALLQSTQGCEVGSNGKKRNYEGKRKRKSGNTKKGGRGSLCLHRVCIFQQMSTSAIIIWRLGVYLSFYSFCCWSMKKR